MNWFPLFVILLLMSCNEKIPKAKKPPVRSEHNTEMARSTFQAMVHLDPRVKIDTERREILVTGQSGDLCGISFKEGQTLTYELPNDNELEINLGNETLKLARLHHTVSDGIYGDWQTIRFNEEKTSQERIVTFFIRDQLVMDVDVYCEQREEKLFEEFE
jgi:hypothetical protein